MSASRVRVFEKRALMLTAYGVTHPGKVRPSNEDSMHWDLQTGLFVVADGMGGHQAGEVASRLAIDAVRGFLESSRGDRDLTWPFGFNPSLSFNGNRLVTAVKLANRRVFNAGEEQPDYAGMGTTIVAVLVDQQQVSFCGVGDSRLYLFANGHLTQLTHDDSWVAIVLANEPGVDESTLAHHPMRHVLTNVVGARDETDVEASERTLKDGELLLLCSDGLHGSVDDATLGSILARGGAVEKLAEQLVVAALDRNATDNVTALLVRNDPGPAGPATGGPPPDPPPDPPTQFPRPW
jgi:serine/threonine protein phosphatase PrpC